MIVRKHKLTMLALTLASCVTSFGDRVLETSHPQAPEWAGLEENSVIEKDRVLQVVHRSDQRILSLPLGVKQEQLRALDTSKAWLGKYGRELFSLRVGSEAPRFEPQFEAALAKAHDTHVSVKDMYYEKVAGEPDYYRVQILVVATSEFIPALFRDLHGKLQTSREKSAGNAANKIQDLFQ